MAATASLKKKITLLGCACVIVALLGWSAWDQLRNQGPGDGFASGNGRLEATSIDISTKLAGRIRDINVQEGDFVKAGQTLVKMQIDVLQAQRDEAVASYNEAMQAAAAAAAQVALRESDVAAARAVVAQREADLDAARRRLTRSEHLAQNDAVSLQQLDDDRASVSSANAGRTAALAQVVAAQKAVDAAKAQEVGARARVEATQATIARIDADILDSDLKSPRDARVQLRLAQPGEVLGAGGRVLNLVDLSDVYMTFFLPETAAGKVALGSEARIVLDVAPQFVIPAKVNFVASTAQFTPKTVETVSERQKLMFRVKAQIAPDLLARYRDQVKTGMPGVAWVKVDPAIEWPASLTVKLPE